MTKESIEDTIVRAARHEPMTVLEEHRLADAVQRTPAARASLEAQQHLSSRLAELRHAIQAADAPDDLASILAATERAADVMLRRAALSRFRSAATACAASALLAALFLGFLMLDRDELERGVNESVARAPSIVEAPEYFDEFLPLDYEAGLWNMSAYSIVRVKIPLSSVDFVGDYSNDGWSIEADVLLGEDGLARGIRFAEAEIVLGQD